MFDRSNSHRSGRATRAALLAVCATAAALGAQTKQSGYHRDYGDSTLGGSFDANARASFTTDTRAVGSGLFRSLKSADTASTTASAQAHFKVFGGRIEAAYGMLHARAHKGRFVPNKFGGGYTYDPSSRGYTLAVARLGGYTILNRASTASDTFGFTLSRDIWDKADVFWAGPVPVTVRVAVGAGVDVLAVLDADSANTEASVGGLVRPYGYGTASAGVGVPGASAGLQARLTFLKVNASLSIHAARNDVGGEWKLWLDPIELILQIYARLGPLTWTHDVATWAYPSIGPLTLPIM